MSNHKNLGAVEKLMDGYNPYRQRQEETRGLISKWEPTGLLEGLDGTHKNNMGITILSTSKGVMTNFAAQNANIGGEILCRVY